MKPIAIVLTTLGGIAALFGIKYGYDKYKASKATDKKEEPTGGGSVGGGGTTVINVQTPTAAEVKSEIKAAPKRVAVSKLIANVAVKAPTTMASFDAGQKAILG